MLSKVFDLSQTIKLLKYIFNLEKDKKKTKKAFHMRIFLFFHTKNKL